jgi:hypothetical protein
MPRILKPAFNKRKQTPCVADSQQCVFADVQRHRAVSVDRLTPLLPCLLVALLFAMLPSFTHAQAYERMYPAHDVAKARATIHWNGDTVFIPSWDGLIMRSVDAGRTWEDLRPAGRNWCFYNSAKTSHGIFLLGEPTFWADTYACAGTSRSTAEIRSMEEFTRHRVHPGATGDRFQLAQLRALLRYHGAQRCALPQSGGGRPGTSIHRSLDGGKNWDPIPLPDSILRPAEISADLFRQHAPRGKFLHTCCKSLRMQALPGMPKRGSCRPHQNCFVRITIGSRRMSS